MNQDEVKKVTGRYFQEALKGRLQTKKKKLKLVIPVIILLLFTFLPLPIPLQVQWTLGIFLFTALMWSFEVLPLPVTSLIVPVLLVAYGIFEGGATAAFSSFASPVIFILLSSIIIAEAIRKHGLDRRLSLLILSNIKKGSIRNILFALLVITTFLSMWISNTAVLAIFIPMIFTIVDKMPNENDQKNLAILLLIGVNIGSAIGGMATIPGTAPNALAAGFIEEVTTFTFIDWMKVGLPCALLIMFIALLVLPKLFPVSTQTINISEIRQERAQMPPLSNGEKKTLAIFVPTVILWIIGSEIEAAFGLPRTLLSVAIVGIAASVLLFAVGALEWDDAHLGAFSVYLLLGAGIALGKAFLVSGAAAWIADFLINPLGGIPIFLLIILIIFVTIFVTNLLSNTAVVAIFTPVALSIALLLNINPSITVLSVGLAASLAFCTVFGTPNNALLVSTEVVNRKDLMKAGALVAIIGGIVISVIVLLFSSI
jgi:sodium-dependent dicarboxylate transporter 2/3/5